MKRRDTERNHAYSQYIFQQLNIYDIQGLLKQGDDFQCGVEAYQVADFSDIDFSLLNQQQEIARYKFCYALNIPYYLIITSEKTGGYQIYQTNIDKSINYTLKWQFSKQEFIEWWRRQQSFTQSKAMYNANQRIYNSIIDKDLFANGLAWGVNIDGFVLGRHSNKILAIFEKRICTYKPPHYTVASYDPNRFFHGTNNRKGDYPAWNILFTLTEKLNIPLILLTFDTSEHRILGVSHIIHIDKQTGITYQGQETPCKNLFHNNLNGLKDWLRKCLQ